MGIYYTRGYSGILIFPYSLRGTSKIKRESGDVQVLQGKTRLSRLERKRFSTGSTVIERYSI